MITDKNIKPGAALGPAKMTVADGYIVVGNGSDVGVAVAMSGDTTISNTGAVTIGAAKIDTAMITDANVTAAKLGAAAVETAKIKDANVTAGKLASNAVETAKILDDNVTTAKILNANVTTAKIADANVTSAKLEEGLVQFAKVTVTTGQLLALAATPVELVAAPGASKLIVVHQVFLHHDAGTAYVEPSAPDDMVVQYTDGLDITGAIDATGFLDQTADTWINVMPTAMAASAAATIGVNQAVNIQNTGGEYTTGDGSMDVFISYSIADFS